MLLHKCTSLHPTQTYFPKQAGRFLQLRHRTHLQPNLSTAASSRGSSFNDDDGSGNGGKNTGRASGGGRGGDPEKDGAFPLLQRLLQAFLGWMVFLFVGSSLSDAWHLGGLRHDTSGWKLSIIIPALNEEACIRALLLRLRALYASEELEIIVVDGGSKDRTVSEALQGGASRVLTSKLRGRAAQMNAGAYAASGDILVFMHADTIKPPTHLPQVLRRVLADPRTCLVGMCTLIRGTPRKDNEGSHSKHRELRAGSESGAARQEEASSMRGPLLKYMTCHQFIKSSFYPMLAQPVWYLQGFRLMFGDQVLCCRRTDFLSSPIQGYNPSLPIMEDADLCVRMHKAGPSQANGLGYSGHGRLRQLTNCIAETSGRRLEEWGNVWGTWVHFRIALAWYCGASGDQLKELYKKLYTDAFR